MLVHVATSRVVVVVVLWRCMRRPLLIWLTRLTSRVRNEWPQQKFDLISPMIQTLNIGHLASHSSTPIESWLKKEIRRTVQYTTLHYSKGRSRSPLPGYVKHIGLQRTALVGTSIVVEIA